MRKFEKATAVPLTDEQVQAQFDAADPGLLKDACDGEPTVEAFKRFLEGTTANYKLWMNDKYQVAIYRPDKNTGLVDAGWPPMIHLSIKRLDKKPINDWREMQEIKNELVGPEHEAVELFPAESRKVDLANQYHLWVFANPEHRFPFGFASRAVQYESVGGAEQRPQEV